MVDIGVGGRNKLAAALRSRAVADQIADILDAVDLLSGDEAAFIDGVVAGVSAAGKALVLNTNSELNGLGVIKSADKLITTGQVLALNATPIEVVAAPGPGIYREFLGAYLFLDFNSAAYAGIAAGEDLVFKYTNAAGVAVSQQVETTGFLNATSDALAMAYPDAADVSGLIAAVVNAPIVLHLLVGEVITGDSPLKVRTYFRDIRVASLEAIA